MDLNEVELFAANCMLCELCKGRDKPVFAKGDTNADIVVCGMCPGPDENKVGIPFVGTAGKILDHVIGQMPGSGYDNIYITNIVKCFVQPGTSLQESWMNFCFPYFVVQMQIIKPKVVIALGKDVCNFLLCNDSKIGHMRGKTYDWQTNIKLVATYHPSYLARGGGVEHKHFKTVVNDFLKAYELIKEN